MIPLKEKAIASMLSVGADNQQSLPQKPISILAEENPKINEKINIAGELAKNYFLNQTTSVDQLHTLSHSELMDTTFQPKAQIINNFLYAGTYLFAGAPKVGKSFFMAQLGYHVSSGLPLWEYPVHKGTVLYLALEDTYTRLQKRLSRMYGTDSITGLYFSIHANSLTDGLDLQLKGFAKAHKDTKLIIIDTLQKIRDIRGEKFSYASDYDMITKLKKVSDEHNICILLVHHTRKQAADDCFETISGTNGLLGAADGSFVMRKERRTDNKAVMDIVGRDQQDQRYYLLFEQEKCLWQLIKTESELWKEPPDPLLESIAKILTPEYPKWQGSATDLINKLKVMDIQPNVLSRHLNVSADRLWNEYTIRLETSRKHSGRQINLSLMEL